MKRLVIRGISALILVCMVGCYPGGPEYVHEKDMALTRFDRNVNFADYKTFVMPDSVVFIKVDGDSASIGQEVQQQILDLVKRNFTERDYQLLPTAEIQTVKPDFAVIISAFATSVYNEANWENYWGWYPGWNWLGWSGFYPWYPKGNGSHAYYAYDTGTLSIDMLDVRNADENTKRIPVLWSGVNSGILSGNRVSLCERLQNSINQCFVQSPYLKAAE